MLLACGKAPAPQAAWTADQARCKPIQTPGSHWRALYLVTESGYCRLAARHMSPSRSAIAHDLPGRACKGPTLAPTSQSPVR